jgi:L-lactate dehydrogenase complex protein LldE
MDSALVLTTCLIDSFFPETARAVHRLLQAAGVDPQFPREQTCCGQPAFNAGYWDEAASLARRMIRTFEREPDLPVIIPSGSCAAMIRHGYLELFREDNEWLEKARKLAARTYELTEFLDRFTSFAPRTAASQPRFAYHASCHLMRGLGVDAGPKRLLRQLAPQGFTALPADCCGFGGVFALEYASISTSILDHKLQQIDAADPDFVLSGDVSCLMQIEGGLRKRGSRIRCSHLALPLAGLEPGLR